MASCGIQVNVYVAGDEPDQRELCLRHAGHWIEVPNDSVSRKFNATTEAAGRAGAEYFLILGTDDFMSEALIDQYVDAVAAEVDYVGLANAYFHDVLTDQTILFPGYPRGHRGWGHSLGAGRLLHKRVIEKHGFHPWPEGLRRALDANMHRKLGLPLHYLLTCTEEAFLVDVKTDVNIWPFEKLKKVYGLYSLSTEGNLDTLPEWEMIRELGAPCLA
jgi:hypothetical protein